MTRYEIRVKGNPTRDWTDWFGELQVQPGEAEGQQGHTLRLTGELPDQSALLGVLMRLHNLNLRILSVQKIDED
jgi:hypothetical protein